MMKVFILFFINNVYFLLLNVKASADSDINVGIVIVSQANKYHETLFKNKEKDLQKQAEGLNQFQIKIFNSHNLVHNKVGYWTIFPLLEKLSTFEEFEWVFFLEETTGINLGKLFDVFKKYNSSKEIFVGYALQDNEPTIIHHFAEPGIVLYPHFSVGFFLSSTLVQRIIQKLPLNGGHLFFIDPEYEFAKFVQDKCDGVSLQHESQFCLTRSNETCATWIEEDFPDCGVIVPSEKLHVAVKTCHKFHHDRIGVMKDTWATEIENLSIFSDEEDASIPTIKVPVENVPQGHCEKTLYIMKYYTDRNITMDWLAIVDDDTIISIKRLRKLLGCYNSSETLVIGERYGYGVSDSFGYDYITGGGGMIFSLPLLKLLAENCMCFSIDSPDDMILGLCLKKYNIPVTHSHYFHQARPTDYSSDFLKPFKHVSFHKHWMTDPRSIYYEWLQDESNTKLHTEL